jgi:cytidylate kinase
VTVRKRRDLIVSIDGPVGAGKSTVARILAKKLGYQYIDSGAMYRAVACAALREGIALYDESALSSLINQIKIEFGEEEGKMRTYLWGEDISDEIRSPEVSQASSRISVLPEVRKRLVALQRQMGEKSDGGVVMEGRDIGTVVFPDADIKFFLDGSPEERARRKHQDLRGTGVHTDLSETMREITVRDERDRHRAVSPLRPAENCIVIDSTELEVEQVVNLMLHEIRGRLKPKSKNRLKPFFLANGGD